MRIVKESALVAIERFCDRHCWPDVV